MNYYTTKTEDIIKILNSSEKGLDNKEVNKRIKEYGKNTLKEEKKESKFMKFLDEFKDIMIIILLISAIISFILSYINKESFLDSIIIIIVVILNAFLGFIQELKADSAIDSLKKIQKTKVKVRRNNKIYIIDSEYITKGDILILEAGDIISADARIINCSSLKVDESSLTGESNAVEKEDVVLKEDTPLTDRINMIYAGTSVVYGKCEAIVCEIGNNTEFGKIAESIIKEEKEITPLQIRIKQISKFLSIMISVIIFAMFILGMIKHIEIKELVMLSISLAVAAIPEGLPAIITIILSIGMGELAKKKAIVRKLSSVETLGCTQVICSDKTGTITQNKMQVKEIFIDNNIYKIDEYKKDNLLYKMMILNNDSSKNGEKYIGDPTEIALIKCLEKIEDIDKIRKENKRIDELPFDSDRKMMSVINKNKDNICIYTKGSFDSVINHCKYVLEDNKIKKLTKIKREFLKQQENKESNKAYRILAFAYKELDKNYKQDEKIEEDLIFVGMTAMIDPPREDIKDSINLCKKAHIKPIMITGDSLCTAKAIAKEIGILNLDKEAILGEEVDKMSEYELKEKVLDYSVYARVSPLNKLNIVKAIKQRGNLVAMTGDGVNDAPALKEADIGVGMGVEGTEVSKSVSDIVLSDDSFSSIVTAVREGRRIFDNIRNVLIYLLTSNITEVLIVFIGMIFGIEIFVPIQLLYINLITDSLPAISLAFEKEDKNIMERRIRNINEPFFTPFLIAKMSLSSLLKTIAVMIVYIFNLKTYDIQTASTMAFLTLILLEMIFAYSCRNLKHNIINKEIFSNRKLNECTLLLLAIQIIVFATPLKNIFNIRNLNLNQVIYCVIIVLLIFITDELTKVLIKEKFKD